MKDCWKAGNRKMARQTDKEIRGGKEDKDK